MQTEVTGLDYFGAQYLSSAQGRFVGADPYKPDDDRPDEYCGWSPGRSGP